MDTGGRPAFEPTVEQRERVAVASGGGITQDVIAAALGISVPTLRKYFGEELTQGACQKRIEILEALHATAKKGVVAAQRAYLATPEPRGIAPPPPEPEPEPAGAKPVEGKKAQANANAKTAAEGTDWQDLLDEQNPLAPRTTQ